ncbi:MAG: 2-amino-4-hydroxy-6-hydroxymethyldihydropteridine diphosphokinase [Bryobacteraceae bacterium]
MSHSSGPVKTAYLSLGSNLGDRKQNLMRALAALEDESVHLTARSSVYETEPQDVRDQPWFLNMAVACETQCFPLQLLTTVQRIERRLGRARAGPMRKGPRVIDIDILSIGNLVMETPRLVIPHPRMLERRFVLEPLLEIAPEWRHPKTSRPLSAYLSKLAGQKARKIQL